MSQRIPIGLTAAGKEYCLPAESLTSTFAILARKRSGKSYTAAVMAEEMIARGQQCAIIDPTGAHWGLKSSADGNADGFPIVVFGGEHADVPLDPRSGKPMAVALVEHGFSAIFDMGDWEFEEQVLFVMDFTKEMLRINREAIHLFIDEADTFAPQMLESREQKKCLGAMTRLVKQGGIKGLGVTMITQRSADINKKLLSQIDILIMLRMSDPADMESPVRWVSANVSPAYAQEVKLGLPRLAVGKAYICSNLSSHGDYVEIRERRTFNSGATPKAGEVRREPKVLAKIDVTALGAQIAASVERAKANDPEELKREVAALKNQLAEHGSGGDVERLSQQVADLETQLEEARAAAGDHAEAIQQERTRFAGELVRAISPLEDVVARLRALAADAGAAQNDASEAMVYAPPVKQKPPTRPQPPGDPGEFGPMHQAILNALAELETRFRVPAATRPQIGLVAGYSFNSGSFGDAIAALAASGLVEVGRGQVSLTGAGRASAIAPPRRSPMQLLTDHKNFDPMETTIGKLLIGHPRKEFSRPEIGEATGYSYNSGSFGDAIAKLGKFEVAVVGRGTVRAADWLLA